MNDIIWPKGYFALYHRMAMASDVILNGTILCIDPSSGGTSLPGFAIYEGGQLLTSGTVEFPKPKQDIYRRLPHLYEKVSKLLPVPADILAIEEIHPKMSGQELQWAVGTSISAARALSTFQVPINLWKAVAKATDGYLKGDAMDAEMIGLAMILWCKEKQNDSKE